MKIGVVVPVLNRFQMALDALASVKTSYDWEPFIITNYRENRCIAQSWNEGCKAAIEKWCDYILIINDDILLAPWTVDHLVDYMEKRGSHHISMVTGLDIRSITDYPDDVLSMEESEAKLTTESPNFSCFLIEPETIEVVGPFDENFKPGYFEDNDYHLRILRAGMKAVSLQSAMFYHYGSQTQNNDPKNPVVLPEQFETNRRYYIQKWGGGIGNEQFQFPFNKEEPTSPQPVEMAPLIVDGDGNPIIFDT